MNWQRIPYKTETKEDYLGQACRKKPSRYQSALRGRLTMAQRFIAGRRKLSIKSVKRTTESASIPSLRFSRPLHGLAFLGSHPSSELLGYCQSSAKSGLGTEHVLEPGFLKMVEAR
jgi:hypothetical protein